MKKVALFVEYDGHGYHGWQSQKNGVKTVQSSLENALGKITGYKVDVTCAGRTDAGVHALGQVVHCTLPSKHNDTAWTMGVNSHLDDGIRVYASYNVPEDFNARYSAQYRYYSYVIYNSRIRPGIFFNKVGWYYKDLDIDKMHSAAQFLVGHNDFSSFRASDCQSKSAMRDLKYISVTRKGKDYIVIDIVANAFLHNMVRNIVGTLVEIAADKSTKAEKMSEILLQKDRRSAGHTASPSGLYFVGVKYPDEFGLPVVANESWFVEAIDELV